MDGNGRGWIQNGRITISTVQVEDISYATVKIHLNTDNVNCIKVGKSFSTDNKVTDDFVELTTEGGFKTGDVVSIAGVYNNTAEKMQQ